MKRILPVIVLLIFIAAAIFALAVRKDKKEDTTLSIILSPHYDDAVLSIGGFLAQGERKAVVATFFSASPVVATTTSWDERSGFTSSSEASSGRVKEDEAALKVLGVESRSFGYLDNQYRESSPDQDTLLEGEIAKDIQALLVAYEDKTVHVYGPALFTSTTTHPDHAMLHRAYVSVEKSYSKNNVTFYFYEDYPYVDQYRQATTTPLSINLERTSGVVVDEKNYFLSPQDMQRKEKALKKYTSQLKAFQSLGVDIVKQMTSYNRSRCNVPCEVVYKVVRITDSDESYIR